jgi:hypothetical protein
MVTVVLLIRTAQCDGVGGKRCGFAQLLESIGIQVTSPRPPIRNALRFCFFNITDDGLPTIVHMHVLDADKLLAGAT